MVELLFSLLNSHMQTFERNPVLWTRWNQNKVQTEITDYKTNRHSCQMQGRNGSPFPNSCVSPANTEVNYSLMWKPAKGLTPRRIICRHGLLGSCSLSQIMLLFNALFWRKKINMYVYVPTCFSIFISLSAFCLWVQMNKCSFSLGTNGKITNLNIKLPIRCWSQDKRGQELPSSDMIFHPQRVF